MIKIIKSKKKQYNGQKNVDNKTIYETRNTTQKTKDWETHKQGVNPDPPRYNEFLLY